MCVSGFACVGVLLSSYIRNGYDPHIMSECYGRMYVIVTHSRIILTIICLMMVIHKWHVYEYECVLMCVHFLCVCVEFDGFSMDQHT